MGLADDRLGKGGGVGDTLHHGGGAALGVTAVYTPSTLVWKAGRPFLSSSMPLAAISASSTCSPTAEITIRNSSFRNFLNRISFGLFFKETQTVSVTAADVGAGLDKAEYL